MSFLKEKADMKLETDFQYFIIWLAKIEHISDLGDVFSKNIFKIENETHNHFITNQL